MLKTNVQQPQIQQNLRKINFNRSVHHHNHHQQYSSSSLSDLNESNSSSSCVETAAQSNKIKQALISPVQLIPVNIVNKTNSLSRNKSSDQDHNDDTTTGQLSRNEQNNFSKLNTRCYSESFLAIELLQQHSVDKMSNENLNKEEILLNESSAESYLNESHFINQNESLCEDEEDKSAKDANGEAKITDSNNIYDLYKVILEPKIETQAASHPDTSHPDLIFDESSSDNLLNLDEFQETTSEAAGIENRNLVISTPSANSLDNFNHKNNNSSTPNESNQVSPKQNNIIVVENYVDIIKATTITTTTVNKELEYKIDKTYDFSNDFDEKKAQKNHHRNDEQHQTTTNKDPSPTRKRSKLTIQNETSQNNEDNLEIHKKEEWLISSKVFKNNRLGHVADETSETDDDEFFLAITSQSDFAQNYENNHKYKNSCPDLSSPISQFNSYSVPLLKRNKSVNDMFSLDYAKLLHTTNNQSSQTSTLTGAYAQNGENDNLKTHQTSQTMSGGELNDLDYLDYVKRHLRGLFANFSPVLQKSKSNEEILLASTVLGGAATPSSSNHNPDETLITTDSSSNLNNTMNNETVIPKSQSFDLKLLEENKKQNENEDPMDFTKFGFGVKNLSQTSSFSSSSSSYDDESSSGINDQVEPVIKEIVNDIIEKVNEDEIKSNLMIENDDNDGSLFSNNNKSSNKNNETSSPSSESPISVIEAKEASSSLYVYKSKHIDLPAEETSNNTTATYFKPIKSEDENQENVIKNEDEDEKNVMMSEAASKSKNSSSASSSPSSRTSSSSSSSDWLNYKNAILDYQKMNLDQEEEVVTKDEDEILKNSSDDQAFEYKSIQKIESESPSASDNDDDTGSVILVQSSSKIIINEDETTKNIEQKENQNIIFNFAKQLEQNQMEVVVSQEEHKDNNTTKSSSSLTLSTINDYDRLVVENDDHSKLNNITTFLTTATVTTTTRTANTNESKSLDSSFGDIDYYGNLLQSINNSEGEEEKMRDIEKFDLAKSDEELLGIENEKNIDQINKNNDHKEVSKEFDEIRNELEIQKEDEFNKIENILSENTDIQANSGDYKQISDQTVVDKAFSGVDDLFISDTNPTRLENLKNFIENNDFIEKNCSLKSENDQFKVERAEFIEFTDINKLLVEETNALEISEQNFKQSKILSPREILEYSNQNSFDDSSFGSNLEYLNDLVQYLPETSPKLIDQQKIMNTNSKPQNNNIVIEEHDKDSLNGDHDENDPIELIKSLSMRPQNDNEENKTDNDLIDENDSLDEIEDDEEIVGEKIIEYKSRNIDTESQLTNLDRFVVSESNSKLPSLDCYDGNNLKSFYLILTSFHTFDIFLAFDK